MAKQRNVHKMDKTKQIMASTKYQMLTLKDTF